MLFFYLPGIYSQKRGLMRKYRFMEYWMYILYSASLRKFYIGSSNDPAGRLRRHLTNHKGFTALANDWQLVYSEKYLTKSEALHREKQLKSWKNNNRIQALISKGSEHPDT